MARLKCPHCRKKLGRYMYATACPVCHKELEYNRRPTGLLSDVSGHPGAWMIAGASLGMIYVLLHGAGVPVPWLGKLPGFGAHALVFIGAGLIGAIIGRLIGAVRAGLPQAKMKRRAAFLASFDLPVRPTAICSLSK